MDELGRRAEDSLTPRRPEDAAYAIVLAAIVAVAAFLRFDALGAPSYWLDELLGHDLTTVAARQPWWRWLTGFDPEHGPLYYATQLVMRIFGSDEAAGRAAAALFGTATVPLVWIAARRATGTYAASVAAAALLATSPLHVYYSREARPYALLIFLTAALLIVLLGRESRAVAAVIAVAIVYTTAVGVTVIAAAAMTAFVASAMIATTESRRRQRGIGIIVLAAALLFPLVYGGGKTSVAPPLFPPLDAGFFANLARGFTVAVLESERGGNTMLVLLALAVIGAATLAVKRRDAAMVVVGMTLLPIAIAIALLAATSHWYAVRYVSPAVAGFIVLAGAGISAAAGLIALPLRRRSPQAAQHAAAIIAIVAAVIIGRATWPVARVEPMRKLDWRAIASAIWSRAKPGDVIVPAEAWSEVALRHYLSRLPPRVDVAHHATRIPVAHGVVSKARAAWLVTAGWSEAEEVRHWMCGYPVVLSSDLESFRLHFAPDAATLLRRGHPAEQRALAAALGERFTIDMSHDPLLGDGWAGPEGVAGETFRWVTARHATVSIPRRDPRDRVIRMRILPLSDASLPRQTLRVSLNGHAVSELTLEPGWRDYAVRAERAVWKRGHNVLALEFARTNAPADLNRASHDRRPLAAAFDWISVESDGANGSDSLWRSAPRRVRLSDALLVTPSASHARPTTFPPERLRREHVETFLGRLGFDPVAAWPRVASGEVHLEELAETLAHGSDCLDDRTFLIHAFDVLLGRHPGGDAAELLAALRAGTRRTQIVRRILSAHELRSALLVDAR